MYRRQMLCFLTPKFRAGCVPLGIQPDPLSAACERIGFVHFASMALLPGVEGRKPKQQRAQLLLEIAVDDGIKVGQVIDALILHAQDLLLSIFVVPAQANETDSARLRRFLKGCLSKATGGYVGARDRSVAQIRAEGSLFHCARRELDRLKATMKEADRCRLALAVVSWFANQPQFRPLASPAVRSFWRRERAPALQLFLMLSLLVVPNALLLGGLVLSGYVGAEVMHALPWEYGLFSPAVAGAALLMTSYFAAWFLVRTNVIAVSLLAALLILGGLLLILLVPVLDVVLGLLKLPLVTWADLARYAVIGAIAFLELALIGLSMSVAVGLGLLRGSPYVLYVMGLVLLATAMVVAVVLGLGADYVAQIKVAWPADAGHALRLALRSALELAFVGATLMALERGLIMLLPRFTSLVKAEDRPSPDTPVQACLVPAVIEQCEAELLDRPNHIVSLTDVRKGLSIFLWFWLRMVSYVGNTYFTNGRLGGAAGIKFGHWHIVRPGPRLLFVSNYDGSFGGYLDEFILGASQGVNLFWRWTALLKRQPAAVGQPGVESKRIYPATRLWAFGGCRNEQAFKSYARASMVPYRWLYQAYRYSNQDIERATRLRDSLSGARTTAKDDAILRALES